MAFGGLGAPGAIEASIGLAGLAEFVLGRSKKFGPECSRVRGRIQKALFANYRDFIQAEGNDWALNAELNAANDALEESLKACVIDRKRLVAVAVTPAGFSGGAVALIMGDLGQRRPDLFASDKSGTIAYRFAHDVVRAGIEAAVEDLNYYRQIEPLLMLEMASTLGIIHAAIDAVRGDIRNLPSSIDALVQQGEKRAREFGIKEGLLIALARNYAEGSPADFDAALNGLQRALEVAHAEESRDRLPSNVDSALDAVLKRIDRLNGEGQIAAAQDALEGELAAMDEEDARRRAARSRLCEKGLAQAILLRSVANAVRFICESAKLDGKDPADVLAIQAAAQTEWYERGRDKGLNFDLEVAIDLARSMLEERTRERVPLDWAMTQNNLGNALRALGARESGTARLEEAVAAYRLGLEERARQRIPLDWAATQNNLGNALASLGERENGTGRLEEAVVAYRLALEERARERVPLDWAMTQSNLGAALQALGERESGVTSVNVV